MMVKHGPNLQPAAMDPRELMRFPWRWLSHSNQTNNDNRVHRAVDEREWRNCAQVGEGTGSAAKRTRAIAR